MSKLQVVLYLVFIVLGVYLVAFTFHTIKQLVLSHKFDSYQEVMKEKWIVPITMIMILLIPCMFLNDIRNTVPTGKYSILVSVSPSGSDKIYYLPADIYFDSNNEIFLERIHWPNGGYSRFDEYVYEGENIRVPTYDISSSYYIFVPEITAEMLDLSLSDILKKLSFDEIISVIIYFIFAFSTVVSSCIIISSIFHSSNSKWRTTDNTPSA